MATGPTRDEEGQLSLPEIGNQGLDQHEPGKDPGAEELSSLREEMATFRSQIEDSQRRESEANERLAQANRSLDAVLQSPNFAGQAQAQPEPLGEPPDPISDADGFKNWQARAVQEVQAGANAQVQALRNEVAQAQQLDNLWREFQTEYPHLANSERLVRFSFMEETGGKLPADPQRMKKVVAERAERELALARGEDPAAAGPAKGIGANTGRTAGVSSGTATAASPAKKNEEGEVRGLVDVFLDNQQADGMKEFF